MEKFRRGKNRVEQKIKDAIVYAMVGVVVAAPIFYALGHTMAEHSLEGAVSSAQMKYELAKNALEMEVEKARELEGRIMQLETSVENLTKILETVYSSVSTVKKEGNYNDVVFTARALYVVPKADFCIDVDMNNTSERQKTLEIWLSGEGILEEREKITLYPRERRTVQVCGRLKNLAANAGLVADGTDVLTTLVVVE